MQKFSVAATGVAACVLSTAAASASAGLVQRALAEEQAVVPGGPVLEDLYSVSGFTDRGEMAFFGVVSEGGVSRPGLFVLSKSGLTQRIGTDTTIPGEPGPLSELYSPQINQRGDVALGGRVGEGDPPFAPPIPRPLLRSPFASPIGSPFGPTPAYFLSTPEGLSVISRLGDPVPGTESSLGPRDFGSSSFFDPPVGPESMDAEGRVYSQHVIFGPAG
ncbi:MAG: hypothetical protein AAFX76_12830 [Planctomycetota bacterium]